MESFLTHLVISTLNKFYWYLSKHWHNFSMSKIKIKIQTRFTVLFTSRSSLTWGNLQVPSMASPPGIHLLSTLNNRTFSLLQKLHYDRIHLLWQQRGKVGWEDEGHLGGSQYLPLPGFPGASMPHLRGVTVDQLAENLGEHSGTPQCHGLSVSTY